MATDPKHIVIDARIRRASTGRPIDRLLAYLPKIDTKNHYTVLVEMSDPLTFKQKNFSVLPIPYKQFSLNPFQQLSFAWRLYRLKPDLVFFTLTGQAPLLYFGKTITFTHDLTMLRYARAGKLPEWLHALRMVGYRLLFKSGNRRAQKIIVPSNFVAQDLEDYLPSTSGKIAVIYEASEPPLKTASKPPDFQFPISNFQFLLHAGSPFPHKNIKRLVKAFEKLKDKHPDLKLVLAGKKEFYFNELEHWLDNRKYSEDVIITGFIPDAELKWLYENAECYVLPSLSEGFGLPGLEAMAHGCPLVSSSATCLPEIYGEAAVYFDPNSMSDMAEKVDSVLSSEKLRAALVTKGKKQLQKYSWVKMSQEIADIIYGQVN